MLSSCLVCRSVLQYLGLEAKQPDMLTTCEAARKTQCPRPSRQALFSCFAPSLRLQHCKHVYISIHIQPHTAIPIQVVHVVGFIIAAVLFSFLNLVSSGYTLQA